MVMDARRSKRGLNGKAFIILAAVVLVVGCAIGGTVAWLVANTSNVVNTFTYGDINITLAETTGADYTIIPGVDIPKDPTVTVAGDSEDCYLFVKVDEAGTFVAGKVTYAIADGWTQGDGTDIPGNVYYRVVNAADTTKAFSVLKDNRISVSDTLTKADVQNVTVQPTLTFTAYAVQKDKIDTPELAWAQVTP